MHRADTSRYHVIASTGCDVPSGYISIPRDRLHCLRCTERIQYKPCITVFKALHGMAPEYPTELCTPVVVGEKRAALRSASTLHGLLNIPRRIPQTQTSTTVLLVFKDMRPGTVCLRTLEQRRSSSPSRDNLRHICLPSLNHTVKCPRGVVFTLWRFI